MDECRILHKERGRGLPIANILPSLQTVKFSRKKKTHKILEKDYVRDCCIRQLIKYQGVNDRIGDSKSSRVG